MKGSLSLFAVGLGLMACGGVAAPDTTDVSASNGHNPPQAFCPGTVDLDAALVASAERIGLDYTIDCGALDAAAVKFFGRDGDACSWSAGDVCVGPSRVVAHLPQETLTDRVELALLAWLEHGHATR